MITPLCFSSVSEQLAFWHPHAEEIRTGDLPHELWTRKDVLVVPRYELVFPHADDAARYTHACSTVWESLADGDTSVGWFGANQYPLLQGRWQDHCNRNPSELGYRYMEVLAETNSMYAGRMAGNFYPLDTFSAICALIARPALVPRSSGPLIICPGDSMGRGPQAEWLPCIGRDAQGTLGVQRINDTHTKGPYYTCLYGKLIQ